jgi:uncharacterized membrane protein (DUF485 family)
MLQFAAYRWFSLGVMIFCNISNSVGMPALAVEHCGERRYIHAFATLIWHDSILGERSMAGFEHRPAATQGKPEQVSVRSTRYGWILFVCYALLYGGFVLLNAFHSDVMQDTPWGGINLAVLYGLGLIVSAFLLAIFYDWLCRFLTKSQKHEGEVGP